MTARQSIQIEKETRGIPSMLAGNVDELAQHVASAVRAEVDFYKSTRAMADDDLLASCTENIRFALKSLEGGVAFDTLPAASTGSDGVDVADSQARKAALREGQIWAFFATKERAEKFTAARQAEGYVRRAYEQTSQPAMRSKCAGRRRPLRHGPHRQFGRCIIAGGVGAGTRPHTKRRRN